MRAAETGSSVGSSYVDALAYAVSSCVTEPSWRRGVRHGAGQPASASPAHAKMPRGASEQHSGRSAMECPHPWMGAGPALGTHRHGGTDPRNSQRARRVALACEVVSEDHITRSKTARGATADPDFHLPHENKNVLSPGRGVPIAPMVRRETAEHEVGTRLKRNVVALLGRQREIFKMGLAVLARIYPYDHARAPSHREIIVHARSVLGVIADDETSGILAPHASTGICAESMKLIVVRPLLIDVLHALESRYLAGYPPFATDLYDGRSHGT